MRSTTNNWKMPVFAWISVTWSRQMPGQLPERVPDWQSPMAIPRRRRERQHHDVPPPWLRVPRWIQRGPGMAMAAQKWAADGWWWNDAGISEAAVLIYRCQDIVIIPPQKKKNTILLTARWKVLFRHGRFWFDHQTRGAIEARLSDRCHGSYGSVWSIRWSGDVRLECRLAVKLGTVFERNVWDLLHLNILNISLLHIKLKVKRSIKYIYIYLRSYIDHTGAIMVSWCAVWYSLLIGAAKLKLWEIHSLQLLYVPFAKTARKLIDLQLLMFVYQAFHLNPMFSTSNPRVSCCNHV
jgi:hypothetical protein